MRSKSNAKQMGKKTLTEEDMHKLKFSISAGDAKLSDIRNKLAHSSGNFNTGSEDHNHNSNNTL